MDFNPDLSEENNNRPAEKSIEIELPKLGTDFKSSTNRNKKAESIEL